MPREMLRCRHAMSASISLGGMRADMMRDNAYTMRTRVNKGLSRMRDNAGICGQGCVQGRSSSRVQG